MNYYFEKGYNAYYRGYSSYACPYLWGHPRNKWLQGWETAREESF